MIIWIVPKIPNIHIKYELNVSEAPAAENVHERLSLAVELVGGLLLRNVSAIGGEVRGGVGGASISRRLA